MATTRNGLTPENWDLVRSQLAYRESGGDYTKTGGAGGNYLGAYQMGAQALETQGYLSKGSYSREGNSAVWNSNNWVGKDGVSSARDFLNNSGAQENAVYGNTVSNYRTMERLGLVDSNTSQAEIGGKLSASHLIGVGGLKKDGLTGADAFGTTAGSYYGQASDAIKSGSFDPLKGKTALAAAASETGASAEIAKKVTSVYKPGQLAPTGIGNTVVLDVSSAGANDIPEEPVGPVANPLESYASFNTLFTFSCLTKEQINFPEKTYLKGDPGRIIFSSAGREPNNRVSTAYVTSANKTGEYDYFVDNIQIDMVAAPTPDTKGALATNFEFDVYEPYSLGMFLQSCQIAGFTNGYSDYTQAPFLLTMEFIGYNGDGQIEKIPGTTRYFPLQLKQMSMEVKAGGSKYHVTAIPWTEGALLDSHNELKQNIAISGATVQEMLQSGENSLQYVVNSRFQEMAKESASKYLPDEVVIVFPILEQETESPSAGTDTEAEGTATTATTTTNTAKAGNAAVASKLTLSRPGSLLIQSAESVSKLGKASLNFNVSRAGEFPKVGDNAAVIDGSGGVVNRKLVEVKPDKREFVFSQGTTIVNAITEVMLMSDYCTKIVSKKPDEKTGMIDWFKIETQVYLQDPVPGNGGNNRPPKLLVYRVVPYKVHMSKFQAPTVPSNGFDEMKKRAAKVYNYIYTGQNVDIINFNIEMKNAMRVVQTADGGIWNGRASQENRNSQGGSDSAPLETNNAKGKFGDPASGNKTTDLAPSRWQNSDGSVSDNYKTLVAKQFQYALLESNKVDMVEADLEIWGDPYFIADSGMSNYRDVSQTPITPGGSVNIHAGEMDIVVNFKNPIDIGENGIMEFAKSDIEIPFSGLYQIKKLKTSIVKGKFTQVLSLLRRPNQNPMPKPVFESGESAAPDAYFEFDDYASQQQIDAGKANANSIEEEGSATVNPKSVSSGTVVPGPDEGKVEPLVTERNNAAVNTATDLGVQVA